MRLASLAVLAAFSLPLFSQTFEIGPYYTFDRMTRKPLGTVRQAGGSENDTQLRNGMGIGLRLTYNTKGYYGHEVSYVRSQVQLRANVDELLIDPDTGDLSFGSAIDRNEKIRVSRLSYNFLMYMMPSGEKWRPYITAGALTQQVNAPRFLEFTDGGGRSIGFDYGGGIKMFPVKHIGIRIDFRHIFVGQPYSNLMHPTGVSSGNVQQFELSSGISFAFSKLPKVNVPFLHGKNKK